MRSRAIGQLGPQTHLTLVTCLIARSDRLGLYIFGRRPLLENTVELAPVVKHLLERPQELQLVLGEVYPTQRSNGPAKDAFAITDVVHMARFVKTMQEEQAKRMAAAMEAANEGAYLALSDRAGSATASINDSSALSCASDCVTSWRPRARGGVGQRHRRHRGGGHTMNHLECRLKLDVAVHKSK